MKHQDDLVKVYIGVEATALLLKAFLAEAGIESLIKNDAESAFLGVLPQDVDLYVEMADFQEAETLINDYLRNVEEK
jgi:hypothetical protein